MIDSHHEEHEEAKSEKAPLEDPADHLDIWDLEPEEEEWTDPETGLLCLVVRNPRFGTLCGYVRVPAGHPLFGADLYGEEGNPVADEIHEAAHGGITWTDERVPNREPDGGYWFGFDCAHAFDKSPYMDRLLKELKTYIPLPELPEDRTVYRDFAYVKGVCADLAKALAKIEQ